MKRVALALIACVLIIAACKTGERADIGAPFIGGTEGITMEYLQDAPPAEVFDGGDFPFDIVVKLQNKGEWLIPAANAVITISGILPAEFQKTEASMQQNPTEDLLAMRKDAEGNIIKSNPVFVEFTGFNHATSIAGATQTFPLRATACYAYGTLGNALLCSRKNILAPAANGVCLIDEDKQVFNSGAPVQVTSLREDPRAPNKIGFTFKVQYQGEGKIYERGSVCLDDRAVKDKVFVDVKTGLPGLRCTGLTQGGEASGFITLFGGEKIITCTQQIPSQSDFKFPVVIELTYDFEEDIQTDITVKSIGS